MKFYLSVWSFLLCVLGINSSVFAQLNITLADHTLRLGSKEESVFSYNLEQGQQLLLNVDVENQKEIQEIEFYGYPGIKIFSDYGVTKIENKRILIPSSGKYKLKIKNNAATKRICHFTLQRVLENDEIEKYNPDVLWHTYFDTTYTSVTEKYLLRTDTTIYNITDKKIKVASKYQRGKNRTTFNFTLPENTIAWSYYVGVDQEGEKAFQHAVQMLNKNLSPVLSKIPNYGPLAALALGGASFLTTLNTGEDINYYMVSPGNELKFLEKKSFQYLKKGHVINDFSRLQFPLSGSYHFCLDNDNYMRSVMVSVKIVSVSVTQIWDERTVRKMQIKVRKEPYFNKSSK